MDSLLTKLENGASVVTATRGLSRYWLAQFNQRQIERGCSAWPTPEVIPWSAWVGRTWQSLGISNGHDVILSESQVLALWIQIIEADVTRAGGARSLWRIRATARRAQQAWQLLCHWRLPPDNLGPHLSADSQVFQTWAQEYSEVLTRSRWIDDALLPGELIGAMKSCAVKLSNTIVLSGFNEFTPVQQAILTVLREQGVEIVVDPGPMHDGARFRRGFRDVDEELAAAAAWSRIALERCAGGPIGVIVPTLEHLRGRVERHFEDALSPGGIVDFKSEAGTQFDVSFGQRLAQAPMVAAALTLLRTAKRRVPVTTLSNVLRSPFISGAEREQAPRALLDLRLRGLGNDSGAWTMVRALLGRGSHATCSEFIILLDRALTMQMRARGRRTMSDWTRWFTTWLAAFGWPGERALNGRECQTLETWHDALSEFATLGLVLEPIDFGDALTKLTDLVDERVLLPRQGPARVHVMAMPDAVGMEFSSLWITGLNDTTWPAPPRPNPFLPIALQKRYRMPHADADREFEHARRVTNRLLASADHVVVSFAAYDGEQDGRASALIAGLPLLGDESGSISLPFAHHVHAARPQLESIVDDRGCALDAEGQTAGGVGLLRDQSLCPFLAYARRRLGARDIDIPVPGLSAKDRGILTHEILAAVWQQLETWERLTALSTESRTNIVRNSVEHLVDVFARRRFRSVTDPLLALEKRRLCALVDRWLEIDAARAPFAVVAPEQEYVATIGGITLTLRVDRVDRLADGSLLLIDYKTGKVESRSTDWSRARPRDPQLPLYRFALGDDARAIAFAIVRSDTMGYRGLAASPNIAPGIDTVHATDGESAGIAWGTLTDRWDAVLQDLGRDFARGAADVDPQSAQQCRHCEIRPLCRIDERGQMVVTDE